MPQMPMRGIHHPTRKFRRRGVAVTVMSVSGPDSDLQLFEVPEVMKMLRLSRTVIYELIRSGRLRSVTQGRARRIPAAAIREYIALLEREAVSE
jgi:excisionase family DNA binding protein